MGLANLVLRLYRRVASTYEKSRYTPYTKAVYLRKTGAQIGEGCFIIPDDLGTEPYLVKIGNHVTIAAEVVFATHDGAVWAFRDCVPDLQVYGPIVIEDNCVIGMRSTIFPNVRIGRNSIVGAGSVVIGDVPPNTLVMGIPARPFGAVDRYKQKSIERWLEQRPPDTVLDPGETWWNSKHFGANRERLKKHLLRIFSEQLNGPAVKPVTEAPAGQKSVEECTVPEMSR